MRLSRKALAVLGITTGLCIGGSLIYALKPAGHREAKELYNTNGRATAEAITSAPKDYTQAPRLGPPLPGDLGRPIVSAQRRGENVPVSPIGASGTPSDPRAQAAEAARQRIIQERDAARTSSMFLGHGAQNAGAAVQPATIASDQAAAPRQT